MYEGAGMAFGATIFGLIAGRRGVDLPISHRVLVILLATVARAVGGAAFYALDPLRAHGGMRKTLANVLSILAYAAFVAVVLIVAAVLFVKKWGTAA